MTREEYLEIRRVFISQVIDLPDIPKYVRYKFERDLTSKLEAGYQTYGDKSYSMHKYELLREVQDEALDIPGWLSILYGKMVMAGENPLLLELIVELAQAGVRAYHEVEELKCEL